MSDLMSIAQISDKLGVSKQAVYVKLKRPDIATAVKSETVRQGNKTLYTLNAVKLIEQAFSVTVLDADSTKVEKIESRLKDVEEQLESVTEQLGNKCMELQQKEQTLNELNTKLKLVESVIESLNSDKLFLQEQIKQQVQQLQTAIDKEVKYLDTIDRLTTALTAAQALHGMDKQQAVIEVNQTPQEPEQQASVDNTVTTESTKKNSLFARLFKRRRE